MAEFRLFPYLRWRIDKSSAMAVSRYKRIYDACSHYFLTYPWLNRYDSISDPFSLIKSAIILEGADNKYRIEEGADLYRTADLTKRLTLEAIHARLPYLGAKDGSKDMRIYVPFFSRLDNEAYDYDLNRLLKPPYSLLREDFGNATLDPFDAYGIDLFDSSFTNLLLIMASPDKSLAAFYSIELETVFVIDDQGRLEESFPLFDTSAIDRRKDHLFARLTALMGFYFAADRDGFIDSLYNLRFVSRKTYDFILAKETRRESRHA